MKNTSGSVDFLYGTVLGRFILKLIMKTHSDRVAVCFLRSSLSKPLIKRYVKRNNITVTAKELTAFRSFNDMFIRSRQQTEVDKITEHLISPCDGWLSAFTIESDSRFSIKNSIYRLEDFLQNDELAKKYHNGTCLVFRLCASDFHHYCYIDNGYQGKNHHIPGVLHSVQPIACEKYPIYTLNKRCWCLLETENFGPVVQCEIGALVVGGIVNEKENSKFEKGSEKGHFELSGSTIVLLFEAGRINLNAEITEKIKNDEEARVIQGQWIGTVNK